MKVLKYFLLFIVVLAAISWRLTMALVGPIGFWGQEIIFEVPEQKVGFEVAQALKEAGLVRSAFGYRWLASKLEKGLDPRPGGYTFSGRFWAWQVAERLNELPDHLWFTSYGCVRREQVGDELVRFFGWDESWRVGWDEVFDHESPFWEGVYFPETYLISVTASPQQVAEEFLAKFEEKVAHLEKTRRQQKTDWPTILTIASLIQREAGGAEDMGIISGVIHNRLAQEMRLQIDSTMQYTLGQRIDGSWWGPVSLSEKRNPSPYNTYLYEGLPPTPICSPGLPAIEAALNPVGTDCLYYLHDQFRQIHCAATYEEHEENIHLYLE